MLLPKCAPTASGLLLALVAAVALVACPTPPPEDKKPAEPAAGMAGPDGGTAKPAAAAAAAGPDGGVAAATPAPPPAPPPGPPQPEPPGITAGGKKVPDAPKGKGTWAVDPAATNVSFTIVSNSAGPITGKFPGGAGGALGAGKPKKGEPLGVFTIDLTKLVTTNKDNAGNPARDINVVEAFFGARAFANAEKKGAVEEVWKKLAPKVKSGVTNAALVVDTIEGAAGGALKDGVAADGVVNGKLILWDSVEVPATFPVTATKKGDVVEVKGTAPFVFNIEKAVGTPIRTDLFGTLLAAGCAHQPGIQNDVSVSLDQVTLKKNAK